MTERYAAFLRGINLGRRRVTGADLEAAFADTGFADASAYQASGNVVFDDDRTAESFVAELESRLSEALGFGCQVVLRTAAEVRALAEAVPFSDDELADRGKVQAILVADEPGSKAAEEVLELAPQGELLRWGPGVLWWLPEAGVSDSPIDLAGIDRPLGLTTMRTKGTIERIAEKYMTD